MEEQIRRARALAESGQKEEARRVLRSLLDSDRTIGPAWAMLAYLETDTSIHHEYLRKTISAAELSDSLHNRRAAEWARKHLPSSPTHSSNTDGYTTVKSTDARHVNNQQKSSPVIRAIAYLVFMFIAAIGLAGLCSSSGSSEPEPTITGAYSISQQFVERRLQAPSTAKFPCCADDFTTDLGGGRYEIVAYVDAQNGFGAMIREDYIAVVKWEGNDEWSLEELIFESDF